MELSRRTLLKGGIGLASMSAIAGCSEPPTGGNDGGVQLSGYTAFFTLWDWANQIAGETITFENPVPVGRMGHGWEPDADLTREIADTDVFIYLDTPEFSWAQDVARQLDTDYPDILVIDGLDGFSRDQLLSFDARIEVEPDRDHDWNPHDVTIAEFDIIDRNTGEVSAYWHNDHWHGGVPEIPVNGQITLGAVFEDDQERVLPLGSDDTFQFDARLAEHAPEDIVDIESLGNHLRLTGLETGRTLVVFQLLHDGDVLWESDDASMDIDVVAEGDTVSMDEFYDPHVWVDPILGRDVVDNLVTGLSDLIPEKAETFEANAATYVDRMDTIHEGLESIVETADRKTAIFAGHNSFQYLEHRYGFELHTPTGVSPDESPSLPAIATTIDIIDDLGIDTILFDPFETRDPGTEIPRLAETIVDNSKATRTAPLSPVEGTTEAWIENGWGWAEQMEEINIPSLEAALGGTAE